LARCRFTTFRREEGTPAPFLGSGLQYEVSAFPSSWLASSHKPIDKQTQPRTLNNKRVTRTNTTTPHTVAIAMLKAIRLLFAVPIDYNRLASKLTRAPCLSQSQEKQQSHFCKSFPNQTRVKQASGQNYFPRTIIELRNPPDLFSPFTKETSVTFSNVDNLQSTEETIFSIVPLMEEVKRSCRRDGSRDVSARLSTVCGVSVIVRAVETSSLSFVHHHHHHRSWRGETCLLFSLTALFPRFVERRSTS
jgi:hypothetical protein